MFSAARDLQSYPTYKTSSVPWLGSVPDHWSVGAVKRSYEIQLGKMLQPSKQAPNDTEVPYLKAVNVQWFKVRTSDPLTMWASPVDAEQYGIQSGDLLVCEGGEGGRCGIVRSSVNGYIIQNALHRVRHREQSLNEYLQSVLYVAAAHGYFEALNDKATIAHFTKDKLAAFRIPVPPLPEQQAIVRYLDHVDRRIRRYVSAKRKFIALLEEEKQAIINQAVTRGLDPNVRLKASGVEWLGDVPEHWEMVRNGQLFVQRNERGFPELPILQVSLRTGVGIRNFENSDRKQMMAVRGEYKRAVRGDIAYNMMRMWQGAVGVVPVDGLVSPAYVVAKPLRGNEPRFFSALFRTNAYMAEVDRYSRGIVKDRNRLYWEDFKQMPTPCPPPHEQVLIADDIDQRTATLTEGVSRIRRQIELLEEYRTRLIADVVTGKLDVRDVAAQLPDEADYREPIEESDPLADGMQGALNNTAESMEELAIEREITA